jgi:hypothetical protein
MKSRTAANLRADMRRTIEHLDEALDAPDSLSNPSSSLTQ